MNAIVINEVDRVRLLQSGKLTASRYLVPVEINRGAYVEQIASDETMSGGRILRWCNIAGGEFEEVRSRYQLGEILCVREPWAKVKITHRWHAATFVREATFFGYQYRTDNIVYCPEAEYDDNDPEKPHEAIVERIGGWQGAQTMPAKIARQFVVVTDIRFQRLSEMVEEDAIAEGWPDFGDQDDDSPLLRYSEIWDKRLNREDFKKFSWFHNPWTCVIQFRLTTPFDEINDKGEIGHD